MHCAGDNVLYEYGEHILSLGNVWHLGCLLRRKLRNIFEDDRINWKDVTVLQIFKEVKLGKHTVSAQKTYSEDPIFESAEDWYNFTYVDTDF